MACAVQCITDAVLKSISDLSGGNPEDFDALLSGVAERRTQDRKDHLDQGDIDFIVENAGLPLGYSAVVGPGFMGKLDVSPKDGRVTAEEMRNGFLQRPAPTPPARSTKTRRP